MYKKTKSLDIVAYEAENVETKPYLLIFLLCCIWNINQILLSYPSKLYFIFSQLNKSEVVDYRHSDHHQTTLSSSGVQQVWSPSELWRQI